MHITLESKILDLNKWILQTFEDDVVEDILNNARKSGEALCKVILLEHYGEKKGAKIILGEEKADGTPHQKPRELNFISLIKITTEESNQNQVIIRNKTHRHQVLNYLEAIRSHGNPASHDTNNQENVCDIEDAKYVRFALFKLITWFYEQYLNQTIPEILIKYLNKVKLDYSQEKLEEHNSYKNVRGFDIVKLYHPKQKIITKNKYNYKDWQKKISYEFIPVEINKNIILGYLFVGKNITIENTVKHFINTLDLDLASLSICSPKVINLETGKKVNRLHSIEEKFKNVADISLFSKTSYFFTDEFIWEYCLADSADTLDTKIENEQYFVDQELFKLKDGEEVNLKPSLDYISELATSAEKKIPVNVIVGRGGVGKTTFCEQAVSMINSQTNKKALLISSTDLRNVPLDSEVNSITDLYKLFIKVNEFDSASVLEPNNFEINVSCGNIILIIDGLDEIESALKGKFNLDAFLTSAIILNEAYQNCSIIITSRDYYLEKYIDKNLINTFVILGFSDILVDRYLNKRLSPQNIKEVKKYLLDFEIADQDRHTPLYLSLICDFIEREKSSEPTSSLDISSSKYFYTQFKLDNLIYQLLKREIGKQSLSISCDDYFDLLVEIVIKNNGFISRQNFDEYIEIFFNIEFTSSDETEKYTQFYVSPLLLFDSTNDFFKIKYDFIETWIKARYVFFSYKNITNDKDIQIQFSDLYDGSSALLEELKLMKNSIEINYLGIGKKILNNLLEKCKTCKDEKQALLIRRSISGLLYFVLSGNSKNRRENTDIIIETFDQSSNIEYLSIFGDFFPLDFTEITVNEGWFDKYYNFDKCKFPNKTVFYYSTFRDIDFKKNSGLDPKIFDSSCSLNDELRNTCSQFEDSIHDLYNKVISDLKRILKVGYQSGGFLWKSEGIYRVKCSSLSNGLTLDKYLNFLILEGILDKSSHKQSNSFGYMVSKHYRDSAKQLVTSSIVKSDMETTIRKILKEFFSLEK